jgi:D-sedoheptulose 7-phosphate isomerase
MTVEEYISGIESALRSLKAEEINKVVEILLDTFRNGHTLFLCGNGGSASTASHLVCDFQKSVVDKQGRHFRAVALTDSMPLITAWSNDFDYSRVFAEQLSALAVPGDVLLAISGSGSSKNVILAVERANEMGLTTIGFAGYQGGLLKQKAQHCIVVPSNNMQQIEDVHLLLGHLIFSIVRDLLAE